MASSVSILSFERLPSSTLDVDISEYLQITAPFEHAPMLNGILTLWVAREVLGDAPRSAKSRGSRDFTCCLTKRIHWATIHF